MRVGQGTSTLVTNRIGPVNFGKALEEDASGWQVHPPSFGKWSEVQDDYGEEWGFCKAIAELGISVGFGFLHTNRIPSRFRYTLSFHILSIHSFRQACYSSTCFRFLA